MRSALDALSFKSLLNMDIVRPAKQLNVQLSTTLKIWAENTDFHFPFVQ